MFPFFTDIEGRVKLLNEGDQYYSNYYKPTIKWEEWDALIGLYVDQEEFWKGWIYEAFSQALFFKPDKGSIKEGETEQDVNYWRQEINAFET